MPPDRLSPQDTSFLYLEGPNTPYHVASLMIFEGAAIDHARLLDLLERRIHLVGRFRQKVVFVPFGWPVWVDDEHFDLLYHVRTARLPPPGDDAALVELCSHLMEQHLSRSRPLWELYLIEGLSNDRFAVFAKTHHCLVDGIAGLDATALLLDEAPEVREIRAEPWEPADHPGQVELAAEALREQVTVPLHVAGAIGGLLRHPLRSVRKAVDAAAGAGALAVASARPAPESPLNIHIGPNRRFAFVRASLTDLRAVKRRLDGTVNDAVLTVVAGALRTWLVGRGVTDVRSLKAMVPVSIRAIDERGQTGNRVSTIVVDLPLDEQDPRRRFAKIRTATIKAKRSHQVKGADLLFDLSGLLPPAVAAQVTKIQHVQRFFNLPITNIPGPSEPMYAAGHRLLDIFPLAPLAGNMAMTVAVLSYAGRMEFGLVADAEAMADLDVFRDGLEAAIDELVGITDVEALRTGT